jgi:hypothetical protein
VKLGLGFPGSVGGWQVRLADFSRSFLGKVSIYRHRADKVPFGYQKYGSGASLARPHDRSEAGRIRFDRLPWPDSLDFPNRDFYCSHVEVVSNPQIAFEGKAQPDEKAKHIQWYVSILKRAVTTPSDVR